MAKLEFTPLGRAAKSIKPYDERMPGICQECSVGCGLFAYVAGGAIVDLQGDEDHPVSRGRLCARGLAFPQGVAHPERLSQVGSRQVGESCFLTWESWDKALDVVAEPLRKIKGKYGSRSLLIACAPEAGLDFYLGGLRFAKLWGTPYVFQPRYSPGWPPLAYDAQFPVQSCPGWQESQAILLLEADLAVSHPVACNWLLSAQARGTKIFALDSRFTPTMSKADEAWLIKPESGNRVGLALMKLLLEAGACDQAQITEAFEDGGAWPQSYAGLDLQGLPAITGLSEEKLRELANFLARHQTVTVITGRKLNQRPNHRVWPTMAAAMGWSRRGSGWYPLDFAFLPVNPCLDLEEDEEPAEEPLLEPEESEPFCLEPGHPIKAVICSGNSFSTFLAPLRKVLEKAELVVYFGAYPTETYWQSHWAFPAQVWAEQNTLSFTNDRALQWGPRLVAPKEGCRSGLAFWNGLARRYGDIKRLEWKSFFPWEQEDGQADHRAFYDWLLQLSPLTRGYQVQDLMPPSASLHQWPAEAEALPTRRQPWLAPEVLPGEAVSQGDGLPLYFQTGPLVSQSTEASSWWPWLKDLEDRQAVQVHPAIAEVLGIDNGEEVVVEGADGGFSGRARVTRTVPRWLIWSATPLEGNRVIIHRPEQSAADAAARLREILS